MNIQNPINVLVMAVIGELCTAILLSDVNNGMNGFTSELYTCSYKQFKFCNVILKH